MSAAAFGAIHAGLTEALAAVRSTDSDSQRLIDAIAALQRELRRHGTESKIQISLPRLDIIEFAGQVLARF